MVAKYRLSHISDADIGPQLSCDNYGAEFTC
jgi:hypothetical protein